MFSFGLSENLWHILFVLTRALHLDAIVPDKLSRATETGDTLSYGRPDAPLAS